MKYVRLDLTGFTAAGIGDAGICEETYSAAASTALHAYEDNRKKRDAGEVGFWNLPEDRSLARSLMDYARSVPAHIDTVVVLGIGGSSLGAHAVYSALASPYDCLRPRSAGMPRRLFFPDNSDPHTFRALLELLPLERTLFHVVTKSGGTAETVAQLLVVAERLQSTLGPKGLLEHLVVTTDPEKGPLCQLAKDRGLTLFPIPHNVGGRFSVLSSAGLLPAALAGLDVIGLLEGAATMRGAVMGGAADSMADLHTNPALCLATLLYLHHEKRQRPMVVVMPYADALYDTAGWFRQLWAESLGKAETKNGDRRNVGPTPIASRGATDQHSQLQLYAEGPDDKSYLFLTVGDRGADVAVPQTLTEVSDYAYLYKHGMGELLDCELLGTRASLTARGRPNGLITLDRLDAPSLGALFMLFEATTAFAGSLYNVNAFDQPGVEEAKALTFAALGRAGYEKHREFLAKGNACDERFAF